MQCGATLTLLTAIEQAAQTGNTAAAADIASRLRDYIGESATGWCDFHDTVDETHERALGMLVSGDSDAALWALFEGLTAALKQVHGHLDLARQIHMTSAELEMMDAER